MIAFELSCGCVVESEQDPPYRKRFVRCCKDTDKWHGMMLEDLAIAMDAHIGKFAMESSIQKY